MVGVITFTDKTGTKNFKCINKRHRTSAAGTMGPPLKVRGNPGGGGTLGSEKCGCVGPDPQTPYPLPFALLNLTGLHITFLGLVIYPI